MSGFSRQGQTSGNRQDIQRAGKDSRRQGSHKAGNSEEAVRKACGEEGCCSGQGREGSGQESSGQESSGEEEVIDQGGGRH